ncbi:YoaK family protein [Undibacterium terreum]|uniref:YoaK family protein n=1 Tax=Undibacterium terreum TaxID=1224302 RepID=UPI00280B2A1C|nr:YoaK family protein [Undibacterium terreum]
MDENRRNQFQGISLGCVAGYVDTLGFIALFGLFTAHVTGNFVLIGAGMADPSRAAILLKILAIPAFVIGVAVARVLIAVSQCREWPALTLSLVLQISLLCGFMLCGWLASPIEQETTPCAMVAGLFGSAAMGVHSATGRLLLSHLAPTSMMTGNVTQIVIDTIDVLLGGVDDVAEARCSKFVWPLAAFGAGAALAAFAYRAIGFFLPYFFRSLFSAA